MIDIVWRAYSPDAYPGSMKPQTTLLPPWAGIANNAERVAAKVAEDFFGNRGEWESWFGFDADGVCLRVEITAPAEVTGHYEVELRHVLRASAEKVEGKPCQ